MSVGVLERPSQLPWSPPSTSITSLTLLCHLDFLSWLFLCWLGLFCQEAPAAPTPITPPPPSSFLPPEAGLCPLQPPQLSRPIAASAAVSRQAPKECLCMPGPTLIQLL